MDEDQWLTSADPQEMFTFLRTSGKLSERKARLFGVACCRQAWAWPPDAQSRKAVEVAERYADGACHAETAEHLLLLREVISACKDAGANWVLVLVDPERWATECSNWAVTWASLPSQQPSMRQAQVGLLYDLFGNPFRPLPPLDPAVFAWHGGTVVRLARAAYEERELPSGYLMRHRLAVLADALEEAGCTDQEILGHLRGPGPHTRGCWVVDLLLAKE